MPRYINADEIYYHKNCGGCDGNNCEQCDDYVARKSDIDDIDTADVQEVKHGKWIYNNKGGTDCSVCGKSLKNDAEPNTEYDLSALPYCPHCGARMDGDNE